MKQHSIQEITSDICLFAEIGGGLRLRNYQRQPARAIAQAVIQQTGKTFAILFPRQSGKNELQAQLECYLLFLFSYEGGEIIKISPTWNPQGMNAMRRLEHVLRQNQFTQGKWEKEARNRYRIGNASITFLSGAPCSSIVGATASLMLVLDEAQDILISKYDHEIAPMAAARNAVRVFWGTAWTKDSLLGREFQLAKQLHHADNPRVFRINAEIVQLEAPSYGVFVADQVRRLGRDHPLVRTQFFSEDVDGDISLFHPARIEKMKGIHEFPITPEFFVRYEMMIDIAGSDEMQTGGKCASTERSAKRARDITAITICAVHQPDHSISPTYLLAHRMAMINEPLVSQFEQIKNAIEFWHPGHVVIDATGIGAGVASLLLRQFGAKRILPFVFTASSKSKLGWDFLSIVESDRWKEPTPTKHLMLREQTDYQIQFFRELRMCQAEVTSGVEKRLRWGVPDGTSDPATGEPVHDDWLISAAMVAVLDQQDHFQTAGETIYTPAPDPLQKLDHGF